MDFPIGPTYYCVIHEDKPLEYYSKSLRSFLCGKCLFERKINMDDVGYFHEEEFDDYNIKIIELIEETMKKLGIHKTKITNLLERKVTMDSEELKQLYSDVNGCLNKSSSDQKSLIGTEMTL